MILEKRGDIYPEFIKSLQTKVDIKIKEELERLRMQLGEICKGFNQTLCLQCAVCPFVCMLVCLTVYNNPNFIMSLRLSYVPLGELQTNNQQLVVRKTEIAAELDLKSNSYVEQVVF